MKLNLHLPKTSNYFLLRPPGLWQLLTLSLLLFPLSMALNQSANELIAFQEPQNQFDESESKRPRVRDLGITIGQLPTGPTNRIIDVPGVKIGHTTKIEGDDIRTGVTAVLPHDDGIFLHKVPAAVHIANGFGKLTGTTQIEELGVIETPIVLTNTISAFAVADAVVQWTLRQPGCENVQSVNPVVGECNDGFLNDIRQQVIHATDVDSAIEQANNQEFLEGNVGAGTGVRCLGWKGGIGSSSRLLRIGNRDYVLGVLVQTNFGGKLVVDGVPVGRHLQQTTDGNSSSWVEPEKGSCIIVIASDAPLDSRQLKRIAARGALGLGAVGSPISHGSGDYILAFCTNRKMRVPFHSNTPRETILTLRDDQLTLFFQAAKDATEEAILNSLLQAETISGFRGRNVAAIDPEFLKKTWELYRPLSR